MGKSLETPMNADVTPMNANESDDGSSPCAWHAASTQATLYISHRDHRRSSACIYRRSSAFPKNFANRSHDRSKT